MKPLRTRLLEARERLGVPWEVLERDYLLSWVLAGLASVDELRASLVFKDGTCLRKCYFGDYRFSEDLDFSTFGAPNVTGGERPTARDAGGKLVSACQKHFGSFSAARTAACLKTR